ncbi:MAG: hypothetical protein ACPGJS_21610 [Flammeovirgaceae bacterium]
MSTETVQINCELCVIGMGIAGLNALNSATSYLSSKDQVVVVDRRASQQVIGGMWNNIYNFVRLHQPHPLFTVGSKKWTLKKDPSYLAGRNEIVEHFKSCYQALKNKFSIIEKFGYEYQSHEEVKVGDDYEVHIHFQAIDDALPALLVKAKRCIKAFGFNVLPNKPMAFSTDKVHSIAPESEALLNATVANDEKPIYIIGGGKTSMDVAGLLLAQNPNRKLNFIIGKGTYFLNRDTFFPAGSKKYWQGVPLTKCLIDISLRYDEANLRSATEYIKKTYGLAPFKEAPQTFIGVLSPHESAQIEKAVNHAIYDYLQDVKEENGELFLHYKSGDKQKIEQGSWLINCSGYLFPQKEIAEPVLSTHGKVLNIQKTASTFIFTSFAGYFLPHLWYRDQFKQFPIIHFNHQNLAKKHKETFLYAFSAQVIYNLIRFIDALPFSVVNGCELNYDKWFPLYRQLPVLFDIIRNKKKYLAHTAKTIEQICTKYDIEMGVVGQS